MKLLKEDGRMSGYLGTHSLRSKLRKRRFWYESMVRFGIGIEVIYTACGKVFQEF